jgi:hypothetical protein
MVKKTVEIQDGRLKSKLPQCLRPDYGQAKTDSSQMSLETDVLKSNQPHLGIPKWKPHKMQKLSEDDSD